MLDTAIIFFIAYLVPISKELLLSSMILYEFSFSFQMSNNLNLKEDETIEFNLENNTFKVVKRARLDSDQNDSGGAMTSNETISGPSTSQNVSENTSVNATENLSENPPSAATSDTSNNTKESKTTAMTQKEVYQLAKSVVYTICGKKDDRENYPGMPNLRRNLYEDKKLSWTKFNTHVKRYKDFGVLSMSSRLCNFEIFNYGYFFQSFEQI